MTNPGIPSPETPVQALENPSLSWRELYAGIIVMLIGIVFLGLQVMSHTSSRTDLVVVKDNAVIMDRHALLLNLRNYIFILVAVLGSLLLFRKRAAGWVAVLASLGLMLLIATWSLAELITKQQFNNNIFRSIAGIEFFLLLALLFLLLPSARKKFRAGRLAYIPALLLFGTLVVLYFLQ